LAFYIKIRKIFEDGDSARYSFEDNKRTGILAIAKTTGEVVVLEPLPGDDSEILSSRAGAKLTKEWREGRFPEEAEWAS
jgi:hypothetical protein